MLILGPQIKENFRYSPFVDWSEVFFFTVHIFGKNQLLLG